MKKNFVYLDKKTQHGFALVVVLIVLLILAGVVGSLLSNQTLYLRETADIMAAGQREQDSHNLHNACIAKVRSDLSGVNLDSVSTPSVLSWVNNEANQIQVTVGLNSSTCHITVFNLPATGEVNWTPLFSISTTFGSITEITEFQYAGCAATTNCTNSKAPLNIVNAQNVVQTIQPQFLTASIVQTSWRKP